MTDYLLFIDTEASGLPKNWKAPFSEEGNWPYAVQISWIIYTSEGKEVKRENHFVNNNDFTISPSALAIHGITQDYLLKHGINRTEILSVLVNDLLQYNPLVIGHFMEFDYLVLGAEFYRTGLPNPIENSPLYCTMLGTKNYVRNPLLKFLHLRDLYFYLFKDNLENQHDALVDAMATARCFFELVRIGEIDEAKIQEQQTIRDSSSKGKKKAGCSLFAFVSFIFALILYYWL